MSPDGGSQEEFEEYWKSNSSPRRLAGGWVERRAHPQVNIERYWYNEESGRTVWQEPEAEEEGFGLPEDGLEELSGSGPEWEMSIVELKQALADERREELGLRVEELAKRAVAEYEAFVPRVLSWHDFQHLTFWFFGGLKRPTASQGFFKGRDQSHLFAEKAFFDAAADLMKERLTRMHSIPLTYFIWTFTRAGVVRRDLMQAVGDHLRKGYLPTMDRCSLGTMVWNFTKQRVKHRNMFKDAAVELARPNRVRSLAARNFQNVMIAYARAFFKDKDLYNALAAGIPRLIDGHDVENNKNVRETLFSYTCKDGSEVLADSFRVGNLTTILKEFLKTSTEGPAIEGCLSSMVDYAYRSRNVRNNLMKEEHATTDFLCVLARAAADDRWKAKEHLKIGEPFDIPRLLRKMPQRQSEQFEKSMARAGLPLQ